MSEESEFERKLDEQAEVFDQEQEEILFIVYDEHADSQWPDILNAYSQRERGFLEMLEQAFWLKQNGVPTRSDYEVFRKNAQEEAKRLVNEFYSRPSSPEIN